MPLAELRLANLRSHIAMVSQDVTLFNDSVACQYRRGRLPVEQVSHRANHQAARANALTLSRPCRGALTLIGENGVRLSGGQRQRLARLPRAAEKRPGAGF